MGDFDKLRIHDVNITPGGDFRLLAEFWAYNPLDNYTKEEQPGNTAWSAGEVKAISASQTLQYADLEQRFKDLIAQCWKNANDDPTAGPRGEIVAGGHRPAPTPAVAQHGQYVPMVSPTNPPPVLPPATQPQHLQGIATDWELHKALDRVNAYTFRGDTRTPAEVKADGGFAPSITRKDWRFVKGSLYNEFQSYMKRRFNRAIDQDTFLAIYCKIARSDEERNLMFNYAVWRELAKAESIHMGRMLANEALKSYISTTRCTAVAKGFAKTNGWVFVTLVNGGFLVPKKGRHAWTATFGEQEIAYPGALPWNQIMGFRQVTAVNPLNFTGPMFLRKGFESKSTEKAFEKCFKALSGKKQG